MDIESKLVTWRRCGAMLIGASALLLSACGGSSSGGEQTIVSSPAQAITDCRILVVDKDHNDAADTNDGRYREDGGSGPLLTIQHAVDIAQPCDTVRVRAATTPYTEGGANGGIVIATSGEPDRVITVEGFPGERPVIDQQQNGYAATAVAGFVLRCSSAITLRNFEIRNVAEAGVTTALSGCVTRDITLENLHVHAVYGGNLVAAIRLMSASNVTVRGNRLHDIVKVRDDDINIATNNIATDNLVIDNNIIADTEQAIALSNQSSDTTTLTISNNTLANTTQTAIALDNAESVSIFNNIMQATTGRLLDIGINTQLSLLDNNLYWSDVPEWRVDNNNAPRTFTDFAEWQTAYSAEQLAALSNDPDPHSLFTDPAFAAPSSGDYRLQPTSPAIGAGIDGADIGATLLWY